MLSIILHDKTYESIQKSTCQLAEELFNSLELPINLRIFLKKLKADPCDSLLDRFNHSIYHITFIYDKNYKSVLADYFSELADRIAENLNKISEDNIAPEIIDIVPMIEIPELPGKNN